MSASREQAVGVVGGVALLVVVAGFVVVEARTGPFEHGIEPVGPEAALAGTVTREPAEAPGGVTDVCQPDAPASVCDPPRTHGEVRLAGLPVLEDAGSYGVFLVGGDRRVWLGALALEGDVHRLAFDEPVDGEGLDELVVSLETDADPDGPSRFVVYRGPVPSGQGRTVELSDRFQATLLPVGGEVSVAQIGAVEVSATATARVQGLAFEPGWTYHAWFVPETGEPWTPLGPVEPGPEGIGVLDVRAERVVLAEQSRFVVTLAPDAAPDADPRPGFPVVDAPLDDGSLG